MSLSITPARRRRAKSKCTVASGPMPRSTDEWEMSRSCHKATFSIAGTTHIRTRRARPVRFSVRMGLRLWGIADEPFCPAEKYSSASRTSVRCRCRISTARRSTDEAITPSAAKKAAWRSRGITWVDTGSGVRPIFSATYVSTAGSIFANVPTAPEMAHTAISFLAAIKRSRPRSNSAKKVASLTPNVVGSAWMPWLRPRQIS